MNGKLFKIIEIFTTQIWLYIRLVLLLVFLASLLPNIAAQEPYALHLDKSKGLPDHSVFNLFQDSKGFVWIASLEGLTKYDGVNFVTYKSESQTSTAGSAIQEDKYGRIWYENFDGYLYYIEPGSDSLSAMPQNTPAGYIPYGITTKHLFIFQDKGIDVYALENLNRITTIALDLKHFKSACFDAENFYLFIDNELLKISDDLSILKAKYHLPIGEKTFLLNSTENGIFIVSKLNETQDVHFFDKNLNFLNTRALIEPEVILSAEYINGEAWINSTQGTFALRKNGTIENYFSSKSISSLILDRQQNYWLASPQDGIFIVPNLNIPVLQIEGFLPNKIVALDDDNLLIATKKGEIIEVDKNMKWQKTWYASSYKSEITYLYIDKQKEFISFANLSFNILNLKSKQLQYYNLAVKEIAPINDSYYSFAASGLFGILKAQAQENEFSEWTNFANKLNKQFDIFYRLKENIRARSTAFNEKTQTIYYATNIGLFAVDFDGEKELKKDNKAFLVNKIVSYEDKTYALSSKGNLYTIDTKNNIKSINEDFDLAPFSVKGLKIFENTLVFISQNYIHTIDLKTNKHIVYDINISTYEINDLYIDKNHLFIVTEEGIIQVPKENDSNTKEIAPLFQITQLWSGNKKVNPSEKHEFSYQKNEISIFFSLLDFGKINTSPLFYSINDKEWIAIDAKTRNIKFPELAAGAYHIKFKVNNDIQKASVSFVIMAPFWKRAWFIMLILISLFSLIYAYYRYRLNLLNQQIGLLRANIELEKNLSASILTSIKSQMNPHFFYNALNTIQAYIFVNDKRNANKYLTKFSKLTRLILEMSEKEKISLHEELTALTLYLELEKTRFGDDFNFELIVDEKLETDFCKIPSMLIQPYVENALKHGLLHSKKEKKLRIHFFQEASFLNVVIEDNGIGRAKSKEINNLKEDKPNSFSTNANEKRLALINTNHPNMVSVRYEDLQDEYKNNVGTKVILKIQLV